MPIAPVVGKDFRAANGLRVSVIQDGPPDTANCRFLSVVRNGDGSITYALHRLSGVCPANTNFNLESEWPTNSPAQYNAVMPTQDGAWRIMGMTFVDLNQLSSEWKPQGCLWYVTITRNGGGNPSVSVSALP